MLDRYARDPNLLDFATEKARDVFPNEERPWTKCPLKKHTSSAETHLLFKLAKEGGPGNYADVGSLFGGSTATLGHGVAASGNPGTIYSVDYFGTGPGNDPGVASAPENIKRYFKTMLPSVPVVICPGDSATWGKRFNLEFSGVFIDADHSYESCKADVLAWGPKVKIGGWIAFHDTNFTGVDAVVKQLDLKVWKFERQVFSIKVFRRLPNSV